MFKNVVSGRQVRFALSCLLVVTVPLCLFDRIDVPVLAAIELVLILLAFAINRDYRAHLVMLLAIVLLFCTIGEVYFRLRYFGPAGLSFSRCHPAGYGHPWSNFEYDETTYTGIKPNSAVYFKGRLFTVNDAGFRGKSYPFEKGTNVFRIVLAGASATIGSGLADNETLTSMLEDRLNAACLPKRVEIINLSISGSQYGDMLHVLREFGLQYDPDILMFLANETLIPAGDMPIRARKVHKIDKTHLQLALNQKYDVFSSRFFFAALIAAFREGNITRAAWERLAPPKNGLRSRRDENLAAALQQLDEMKGNGRVLLYLLRPILDLKNRIEQGTYKVDAEKIAEKMVGESLLDNIF